MARGTLGGNRCLAICIYLILVVYSFVKCKKVPYCKTRRARPQKDKPKVRVQSYYQVFTVGQFV